MCNACGFNCCAWDGFSGCGCGHCDNPECWDEDEEEFDDDDEIDIDDQEDEQRGAVVFDCGLEGCLMPGEHLRSECHTAAMLDAMYDQHEQESNA